MATRSLATPYVASSSSFLADLTNTTSGAAINPLYSSFFALNDE